MRAILNGGLTAFLCALSIGAMQPTAQAEDVQRHGLSLMGSLKYPADFKHFDYVNPNAPKGGHLRRGTVGTFDSLNNFILKGRPAGLVGFIYDSLMENNPGEPSAEYGRLAESVSHPDDFSSVTYTLRANARWHDGKPVTPEDVIFSLETFREGGLPFYAFYYANVTKAEKIGDRKVKFSFNTKGNRELPQILGQLTVIPKHYWEGTDKDGKKRDVFATTLEPPLGSGPYRITKVEPGKRVSVERVPDYWGRDIPVNLGRYNFDTITLEYFRDATVALEAFKADQFDLRQESSAKNWATAYDFKAAKRGDVIRQVFKTKNAEPMQSFVLNTRRAKFSDPRVRLAFNHVFDFEWANKNLFYNQYVRVGSYFENSELAAKGLPEGQELEILESVRDKVPPEVFTKEFKNPVGGDQTAARKNRRAALRLLKQAGWTIKNGKLVNAQSGERMSAEFVIVQPSFERIVLPYTQRLNQLGIETSIRTIDPSQYRNRLDNFDFDIVVGSFPQSLSPGNEQRDFWGSKAADRKGSRNLIGIKNPAVDILIEKIIFAKDRAELVAASRALDRVLLWNHYVVPQWYFNGLRLARWNRFSFPDKQPEYGFSVTDAWWYDEKKAASVKGGN